MLSFNYAEDIKTIENAKAFLDTSLQYEIVRGKKNMICASDDEDGSIVGVLVYELFESVGDVRIIWIKVREDMRGLGIAMRLHLLLFSACTELSWVKKISAAFPDEREDYVDAVLLLRNLGYVWTEDTDEILVFRLSEILKNEVLFKKEVSDDVISLRGLIVNNAKNLNVLKNNWINSEINVWGIPLVQVCKEMDIECSMVVEKDGRILAFLLVADDDGKIALRYLACDKSYPVYVVQVIQGAVNAIKEKYGEDIMIETTAINEESKRLFEKLVSSYAVRRDSVLALTIR